MSQRARPRQRTTRTGGQGYRPRRGLFSGPVPIVATLAVVAIVIGVFLYSARTQTPPPEPSPQANSAVVEKVTSVPATVFDAVGAGTSTGIYNAAGGTTLTGASGKPLVIYVGAEFCPYCASQRWSLIAALSRFGRWNGLGLSRSSGTDVFPNTPTFSFRGASYTSDVLEFSAVETSDRDGKPIASMNPVQDASYRKFDTQNSIPYISFADRYASVGSGFPPDVLVGRTWDEIATALRDPSTPISKAVVGNADRITAVLCEITKGQPDAVCSSAAVRGLRPGG